MVADGPTNAAASGPSIDNLDRTATTLRGSVSEPLSQTDAEQLAAEFEGEKPGRLLSGWTARLVDGFAVAIALLVIWQVFAPLPQGSQYYLIWFLAGVLPMIFLAFPAALRAPWSGLRTLRSPAVRSPAARLPTARLPTARSSAARLPALRVRGDRPTMADWTLAATSLVVCLYPVMPFIRGGFNGFLDRQALLDPMDTLMGALLLILVLEACRRTTGWALPVVCLIFLSYAYYGGFLPANWAVAHSGLDFNQIVDALYNSGSGFYGTPLDVAASYIVLFTIFGAVLVYSGASEFFVDLSVAAFRRSRSAAGRTAVASGFLLGTVSGSGAATTVSVGAVTWPILRQAGYPAERAGGMLAAAGVGAILSPPTLGAAAFIIAELLDVSYLQVLVWATIPTVLYYLGILLAVEIDARRFGANVVDLPTAAVWKLLLRYGYHLSSLVVIVVFMALGQNATRAVVYATVITALLSFLDRRHRLTPRRLIAALAAGVRGVLPVAAVCAAAGIITAVTTKTGLGPQAASLIVSGARVLGENPTVIAALTAVFAAVALSLLGLAVPVTASFIIGWVIIGPALINLDIAPPAAAMFVFYFAVLSEATPPTALASVAAAAVTGGRVIPTMWQTLRYALPAYLVPMAFVLSPAGEGLLGIGGPAQVGYALVASALGVGALAVAVGGWLPGIGPAGPPERLIAGAAALILLWLDPVATAVGAAIAALVPLAVLLRRRGTTSSSEKEIP